MSLTLSKRAEAAKAAKRQRHQHIQGALTHLLDFMAGNKEPLDWFNCHGIPTTIHYDRWFGYAYVRNGIEPPEKGGRFSAGSRELKSLQSQLGRKL